MLASVQKALTEDQFLLAETMRKTCQDYLASADQANGFLDIHYKIIRYPSDGATTEDLMANINFGT